jgi:hypothetical protein
MKLDVVACAPWYIAHLAPVWEALPGRYRGQFHVVRGPGSAVEWTDRAVAFARDRGIKVLTGALPQSKTPTLVASTGDMSVARKAGRPVAIMEHGAGQSYSGDRQSAQHPSYAGGLHRSAELFLHPGPHPAQRDREAYPDARVEVVGSPILDTLPDYAPAGGKPVVAVSCHWDCMVCAETRSGFIQFRNAIADLALSPEWTVIGHGHPRDLEHRRLWYERKGIEVVSDFGEVCRRAAVYACDNSSSMFEFAATGRPVVVLNPGCYRKGVTHGLRFWEAASVGLQVDVPYFLTNTVRDALRDRYDDQQAREKALDLVYAYRTGAAERAAAVLVDWIQTR